MNSYSNEPEEDKLGDLVQTSGDLAHQLNNLLTTMLANTQLALLMSDDVELKPYLSAVEEATGEAAKMVHQFQESLRTLTVITTQDRT